jgi:hypothetical protein
LNIFSLLRPASAMREGECPIDGCDYGGTVAAVEGHVSGSTDGAHRGELGADLRRAIADSATGIDAAPQSEGESPDGTGSDAEGGATDEGGSADVDLPPGRALLIATVVFVVAVSIGTGASSRSPASEPEREQGPVGGLGR